MKDLGRFPEKMTLKKDEELRAIAEDMGYVEEARLAAIAELKKREIHEFEEAEERIHTEIEKKEARVKEGRKTWDELPNEIKWVIRAVWASTILSAFVLSLALLGIVQLVGTTFAEPGGIMILIVLLIYFGITALFVIGFERKLNWVRWVFVGLVAYSTLVALISFATEDLHFMDILSVFTRGADIFAAVLLMRPVANAWFTKDRTQQNETDLLDNHIVDERIDF